MNAKRPRRIEIQLPLAIATLLVLAMAAFSWAAYREVRDSAMETARQRLEDVGAQLASILAQSTGTALAETEAAAEAPSLLTAASTPSGPVDPEARDLLRTILESSDLIGAVSVWDRGGHLALGEGDVPGSTDGATVGPAGWLENDRAAVGGFRVIGGEIWYDVAVAIGPEDDPPLGYLVQHRTVSGNPEIVQVFTDLIGMETRFLVGEIGAVWTDLVDVVPGPPIPEDPGEPATPHLLNGERPALGTAVHVPRTRWHVWVELPLEVVLERPRAFLRDILPLGLAIVLVGAVGGWGVSRRITGPLGQMTTAATRLAAGEKDARVRAEGRTEIGELGRAFNHMADSLQAALHEVQQRESEVRTLNEELEQRVSERTHALRESEELFRMLAATAHDGIVSADSSGRMTYFNPGAERIFGYEADEAIGSPLEILIPERFQEDHARGLDRYRTTGRPRLIGRTVELTGRRKDGSEFPVELSLGARPTPDGPAFIGVVRDITARKEVEKAVLRYAAELEATNEELEAFSYSVSHDLRAPLRPIHGFAQAVLEDYGDRLEEEGVDYLRRVCAAAERMGVLIDDLLELSRATRVEMERAPVDLGALAEEVVSDLRSEQPDREVDVRIADGLRCEGDRDLLVLVLRNLLENAWKFTGANPGARVEVGQSAEHDDRPFFVRDDGAGFDATYADKLFKPFQRLHKNREFPGTGVGLALVRRIVHRHGGRIWAEGAEGRGATFYFTLPTDHRSPEGAPT